MKRVLIEQPWGKDARKKYATLERKKGGTVSFLVIEGKEVPVGGKSRLVGGARSKIP